MWLVCTKAELLTASKGTPLKVKTLSVCNLQFMNGLLADPEGIKVSYLYLSMGSLWAVRLYSVFEELVLVLFAAKGILTRNFAVSYLKSLRDSSVSLYFVSQQSLLFLSLPHLP